MRAALSSSLLALAVLALVPAGAGASVATWQRLIDQCVDGVMTSRPIAFERTLRAHGVPAGCG